MQDYAKLYRKRWQRYSYKKQIGMIREVLAAGWPPVKTLLVLMILLSYGRR